MPAFCDFPVTGILGEPDLLGPLRAKVVLAVNVASRCGYTPQYTGLQRLYDELKDEGFVVIGFPCNQFGGQEPGTDEEIRGFCTTRYDVSFPLASRIDVNGPGRHPLYAWLTSPENGHPGDIQWNFEKFLIGRDGRLVARYPSATKPENNGLRTDIAEALWNTVDEPKSGIRGPIAGHRTGS
jgi:glutathione peroxidase